LVSRSVDAQRLAEVSEAICELVRSLGGEPDTSSSVD
jgi:hypothetical protein